jgi:F-type H+-transporting ATPase subunit b
MVAQMKKEISGFSIEIAEKVIRRELADKKAQESLVSTLIADANLN